MAKLPNLTNTQKERLSRLEPQLKLALIERDFVAAKQIVFDIQNLLRPTGHFNRLVLAKNSLFEFAIEIKEYEYAEMGLKGNRNLINKNTRLYLEATALLAICYLRQNEIEKAKPFMQEVLKNEKVIVSSKTRTEFHKAIIERFDEEGILYSLKNAPAEKLFIDEIQGEAGKLLLSSNEEGLYLLMGRSIPLQAQNNLYIIDSFVKKQLPSAERLALPSPEDMKKQEVIGKTFFSSLKRVIYDSLCNPKSEVYKAWYSQGLTIVLDKKYLTAAIIAALQGIGIGIKALAISAVALLLRLGLDVYCEHFKPKGIMEIRKA